ESTLAAAAEEIIAEPKQDILPFSLREEPTAYEAAPSEMPAETVSAQDEPTAIDAKPSPEVEPFIVVREILRRELVGARTEEDVATLLAVTKSQAKIWLARLVKEGVIEKVKKTKPALFLTSSKAGELF